MIQNSLQHARQKINLTQGDIAFLLGMSDSTLLSKIEAGKRKPNIYTIITYMVLCNTSFDILFPQLINITEQRIANIIDLLIPLIQDEESYSSTERIESLTHIKQRLVSPQLD